MALCNLLKDVPNLRRLTFNHLFCASDRVYISKLLESPNDERLKQDERHFLGQTALMQFQLRSYHDHRTARVIHPLAEQVLAEPSTLALEHVAQGLQRTISCACNRAAVPSVIEKRVNRFLQHALLVSNDDIRSLQLQKIL